MRSGTVMLLTLVTAAALLPQAFAQRGGSTAGSTSSTGSTTGSTSPGTPTTTSPPNNTNIGTPNTPNNNNTQTTLPQPIFISGRVMVEDGTAPPETVVLERVCNGSPHAEGYTDSKGYFAIQLGAGNSSTIMQDASEEPGRLGPGGGGFGGGGMGSPGGLSNSGMGSNRLSTPGGSELRYANCELRAKLAGFRSQSVSLANRRAMDNPDIGVILLHRLAANEGAIVSANSLAAPKDAKKAFDKGQEALKKKKPEDAMKDYEKAVELYPHYAAAWYEIGKLQVADGDKISAAKSFDAAVDADPKFVLPLVDIAILQIQDQKWQQVVQTTDKAAKLDSFDYPQMFFFNAVANFNLHNFDAAEQSARQAEKLDTRHQFPRSSQLLGLILAQKKDYTAAADEFRNYLKLAPNASDAATVRSQLAQIEKVTAQAKQD